MNRSYLKDAIKGIAIAIAAAYIYAALLLLIDRQAALAEKFSSLLVVFPLWALANTFWFVIPIGALSGIFIPRAVRGCSGQASLMRGAIFGVVVGVAGSILVSLYFDALPLLNPTVKLLDRSLWWALFWKRIAYQAIYMSLYSALWTSAYAYLRMKPRPSEAVVAS